MSTQEGRVIPPRGSRVSRRRRNVLNVDLNAPPVSEDQDQGGSSTQVVSENRQAGQGTAQLPTPIDLEALDDDVVISSPRAFAEAKNNSRRNSRRNVVVDVDSEERSSRVTNTRNTRRRLAPGETIPITSIYVNLDFSNSMTLEEAQGLVQATAPPPPPPPRQPTFSCPICMGPLVEETSTKCGHIFCKTCIKTAIATQSKCPTCRRKLTTRDTIRVYLPITNDA